MSLRIYVKNQNNESVMPTTPRKARLLIKEGKAEVIQRNPFTIRLLNPTGNAKQEIVLGIDSGYLNIGFSAVSEKEELLAGEVRLLAGMVERNEARQSYRRTRRGRIWHRRAGFMGNRNRRRPLNHKDGGHRRTKGTLAPSIRHKLDSHIRFIGNLHKIIPFTRIVVEIANFDIQKIKNPDVKGKGYQEGDQRGYDNVKAYVLHRDGYKCQNPNCKCKNPHPELHVHHIQYRSKGGSDRPDNLITLCTECHTPENHKGFLLTWKPKTKGFKDATFMSTVREKLVDMLREKGYIVDITYGYLTKEKRQALGIEKSHTNDAFCIADGTKQTRAKPYEVVQVRRNDRSLSSFYDAKYIDSRDCTVKSGKDMTCGRTCRNKNKNGENLRQYRLRLAVDKYGNPKKGRISTRQVRYPIQPMDLVEIDGKKYYSGGATSYGKALYVKEDGKNVVKTSSTITINKNGKKTFIKKPTKASKVAPVHIVKYGKGFCWIDPTITKSASCQLIENSK